MRRAVLALVAFCPLAASAHIIPFNFLSPAGGGNLADGGTYAVVAWQSQDPLDQVTFSLWMHRKGLDPFNIPDKDGGIQITNSKVNGLYGVAWTPGGKIVYASGDGGSADIWMIGADGRDKRQITNNGYGGRYLCVTPDGRSIISDSYRSKNIQLWKIGMDGSGGHVLTSGPGFGADCSHADHGVISVRTVRAKSRRSRCDLHHIRHRRF